LISTPHPNLPPHYKELGVPLGISSFTSSFIKNVLLENVQHADLFPRMEDVQVVFGIITHCFVQ
jgi:hypothetical protein